MASGSKDGARRRGDHATFLELRVAGDGAVHLVLAVRAIEVVRREYQDAYLCGVLGGVHLTGSS